jgi:hypothetical protein
VIFEGRPGPDIRIEEVVHDLVQDGLFQGLPPAEGRRPELEGTRRGDPLSQVLELRLKADRQEGAHPQDMGVHGLGFAAVKAKGDARLLRDQGGKGKGGMEALARKRNPLRQVAEIPFRDAGPFLFLAQPVEGLRFLFLKEFLPQDAGVPARGQLAVPLVHDGQAGLQVLVDFIEGPEARRDVDAEALEDKAAQGRRQRPLADHLLQDDLGGLVERLELFAVLLRKAPEQG